MATRLYPSTAAATVPQEVNPTPAAGWEKATGYTKVSLDIFATGATFTSNSITAPGVSGQDTLLIQAVSQPISGQVISGTVKGQFFANEVAASDDFRAQIVIRVVSGDGTTVRGTLLDFDASALSSEFSTTATNRKFPLSASSPATLTPVIALEGDRIVVEIGFREHSASVNSGNIVLSNSQNSDLAEDETQTDTTTFSTWLEFSQTIVFPVAFRANRPRLVGGTLTSPGSWAGSGTIEIFNKNTPAGYSGNSPQRPIAIYGICCGVTLVPGLDTTVEFLLELSSTISGVTTTVCQIPGSLRLDTLIGYYLQNSVIYLPEPILFDPLSSLAVEFFSGSAMSADSFKILYRQIGPSLLLQPLTTRNSLLRR